MAVVVAFLHNRQQSTKYGTIKNGSGNSNGNGDGDINDNNDGKDDGDNGNDNNNDGRNGDSSGGGVFSGGRHCIFGWCSLSISMVMR